MKPQHTKVPHQALVVLLAVQPVKATILRIASISEHLIALGDKKCHYFIVLCPEGLLPYIYPVGPFDIEPCVRFDGRHVAVIPNTAE